MRNKLSSKLDDLSWSHEPPDPVLRKSARPMLPRPKPGSYIPPHRKRAENNPLLLRKEKVNDERVSSDLSNEQFETLIDRYLEINGCSERKFSRLNSDLREVEQYFGVVKVYVDPKAWTDRKEVEGQLLGIRNCFPAGTLLRLCQREFPEVLGSVKPKEEFDPWVDIDINLYGFPTSIVEFPFLNWKDQDFAFEKTEASEGSIDHPRNLELRKFELAERINRVFHFVLGPSAQHLHYEEKASGEFPELVEPGVADINTVMKEEGEPAPDGSEKLHCHKHEVVTNWPATAGGYDLIHESRFRDLRDLESGLLGTGKEELNSFFTPVVIQRAVYLEQKLKEVPRPETDEHIPCCFARKEEATSVGILSGGARARRNSYHWSSDEEDSDSDGEADCAFWANVRSRRRSVTSSERRKASPGSSEPEDPDGSNPFSRSYAAAHFGSARRKTKVDPF